MIDQPTTDTRLVSVILPVFNSQAFVSDAIESIRSQTFTDWELIIVDDGSLDGSLEICRRYEATDSRVKVFKNEKNLGLAHTMNRLVSLANGKYVAIQEQDDISLPHRLASEVNLLETDPEVGLVSGIAAWMNDRDQVSAYFPRLLQNGSQYPQSMREMVKYLYTDQCKIVNAACMFRKIIIAGVDRPFDEGAKMSIDWQFFLHLAHRYRIFGITEVLVKMRRGHGHKSLTTEKELQFSEARRCIELIYQRYRTDQHSPISYQLYRRAMSTQNVLEGRYWRGVRGWLRVVRAISYNPFNRQAWSSWVEMSFRALIMKNPVRLLASTRFVRKDGLESTGAASPPDVRPGSARPHRKAASPLQR